MKVLLDNLPAPNVSKEEFYNRYKVKYGETVDFNCTNFIEVLSLLPDLVKFEVDKVTRTVLVTPVKSNVTDLQKQMIAAKEKAVKDNVLARIESFLPQLKNVELSAQDNFSHGKISLRLEKILQDKEVAPPVKSVVDAVSNKAKTKSEDEKGIPGKEIKEEVNEAHLKIKVDQMKCSPLPEVQFNKTSSKHDLSDVKFWSRAAFIPRDGHKGIGLCYLQRSKRLVLSCMKGKMDRAEKGKVKMFTSDGRFLKVVTCAEADDGDAGEKVKRCSSFAMIVQIVYKRHIEFKVTKTSNFHKIRSHSSLSFFY